MGAMKVEIDEVVSKMSRVNRYEIGSCWYNHGYIEGKELVVVCCGIGKVNAATVATTLLHKFECTSLINIGVAGGVGAGIKIGDIVLSSRCVQFDVVVDNTNGGALGIVDKFESAYIECDQALVSKIEKTIQGMNIACRIGVVATSDKFIADSKVLKDLTAKFAPQAVEMESGAIAQVCALYKVPFCTIRTISDTADEHAEGDFASNMRQTAKISCEILKRFVVGK